MAKFLLGALAVFLLYNQGRVIQGYHIVMHGFRTVQHTIESPPEIRLTVGPAPAIKTDIEIEEPSLDQLKKLGFNVKKN
jgi:hypothetical protein